MEDFMDLAKDYQLRRTTICIRGSVLDQNTDLLSHFHLVEADEEDH